jgi:hypothetical protein
VRRRQLRYSEAAEYFRRALQIRLDRCIGTSGSGAGVARARAIIPQAQAEVQRVLDTDAANLNARVLRAQLLGDTGQEAEAQRELDALIDSMPAKPAAGELAGSGDGVRRTAQLRKRIGTARSARRQYPAEATVPRRIAETAHGGAALGRSHHAIRRTFGR